MKYLDEYRDPAVAHRILDKIAEACGERSELAAIMEVCGTHTMSIARAGLRSLLGENLRLLSGPGCPVCVTPNDYLDRAIAIARQRDAIIATFGDMMKVPGSSSSLYQERGNGARIEMVYSPLDALKIAEQNPLNKVIFLGVGFETTAPTVAATLAKARADGVKNFFVLCGHKIVPPALFALVNDPELKLDGFLCPGHVSAIIGSRPYEFIARDYGLPCVIAGFEPLDILQGIWMILRQIIEKRGASVEIQYSRAVAAEGNPKAAAFMEKVFEPVDSIWRGLGKIPASGLAIKEEFGDWDAARVIQADVGETREPAGCICGMILRGVRLPMDCPLFRKTCTPENPVGACMVSSEGTCAAYYKYGNG